MAGWEEGMGLSQVQLNEHDLLWTRYVKISYTEVYDRTKITIHLGEQYEPIFYTLPFIIFDILHIVNGIYVVENTCCYRNYLCLIVDISSVAWILSSISSSKISDVFRRL